MNVLIVGLGSIAQKHIIALRQLDKSVNIYALRSSTTAKDVDGVTSVYELSDLKNIKLTFAIVSNPTSEHLKSIKELLTLSCPLFIEKPLYHTLEVSEVLQEIQDKGILTYVACNLRFLDSIKFVKQYIEEHNDKQVNEVNSYCGSYLPLWRKGDYRQQYSAIPELGGGVHIDLIHELDYLYWLFGNPLKTTSVFKNNSSLDIDAIDYANYCLDYNSFCASVILNYYRKDYKRTLEIVFDDATMVVDLSKNTVTHNNEIVFQSKQQIIDTYYPQIAYFVDLIKADSTKSFNSISDAYNVLKITLQ